MRGHVSVPHPSAHVGLMLTTAGTDAGIRNAFLSSNQVHAYPSGGLERMYMTIAICSHFSRFREFSTSSESLASL